MAISTWDSEPNYGTADENQITHSTCALVSEILESMLQTVQKQFTDRQYILTQKTMCGMHIHIVSTHSVLLDILAVINTHYTQNVHILHYVHLYTQWYVKKQN